MAAQQTETFGATLRDMRLEAGISLRKFADMVGVSPTYLSQVEQGNCDPPTAERVQKIAGILHTNADELIALAGRVPEDLPRIIQKQPTQMPELLREASGLTAQQLRELVEKARSLKEQERACDGSTDHPRGNRITVLDQGGTAGGSR